MLPGSLVSHFFGSARGQPGKAGESPGGDDVACSTSAGEGKRRLSVVRGKGAVGVPPDSTARAEA